MAENATRTPEPPGPTLSFAAWCKSLRERFSRDLPDIQAKGTTREVVFSLGQSQTATIRNEGDTWFIVYQRTDRSSPSGHAIDRHDEFTCQNIAISMRTFFSDAHATGQYRPTKREN